jgi:hypothetical protein
MAERWWFKFEWADWLGDRELMRCSLETQGFWIKCLCLMYEADTYFLEGRPSALAGVLGVDTRKLGKCIDELASENAAEIVKKGGIVKIVSRRLLKAANLREYNKLAKRKERKNKNVKGESRDSSKDKSFKASESSSYEEDVKTKEREAGGRKFGPPQSPDTSNHLAVLAVSARIGEKIDQAVHPAIIKALGDRPDNVKLSQCYQAWIIRGFKKANLNWALDWYVNGIPADTKGKNGSNENNRNQTQTGNGQPKESIADSIGADNVTVL